MLAVAFQVVRGVGVPSTQEIHDCIQPPLAVRNGGCDLDGQKVLFVLLFLLELFLLLLSQFWLFPVFLFCFVFVAHGFLLCLKEVVRPRWPDYMKIGILLIECRFFLYSAAFCCLR